MAFLAAHVIADAWNNGDIGNPLATPVFRTTVESDFTLVPLVQQTFGWVGETVVVGDRWLSYATSRDRTVVLGNERSGHLVFPLPVGDGTVYVGNGISSALMVLEALVNRHASIYQPGILVRNTFRTPAKETLFRGSLLWNAIAQLVTTTMPDTVREVRFIEEPDMLCYNLYDRTERHVGRWYIRKSGTEPKISMSMSVVPDSSLDVEGIMRMLHQAIMPMLGKKE
jgi:phosphomannomutase